MTTALDFAKAVLASSGESITPLKLQKLMFYGYGAALAYGEPTPDIEFLHWKHGPVCQAVYEHFKHHGSNPLPATNGGPRLRGAARDAVSVYGHLSAWQLREESHLEAPWLDTAPGESINRESIRAHFERKFCGPAVEAPKNLPGMWSLAADGFRLLSAPTLGELASALERLSNGRRLEIGIRAAQEG